MRPCPVTNHPCDQPFVVLLGPGAPDPKLPVDPAAMIDAAVRGRWTALAQLVGPGSLVICGRRFKLRYDGPGALRGTIEGPLGRLRDTHLEVGSAPAA
jgi:hypothetical protein